MAPPPSDDFYEKSLKQLDQLETALQQVRDAIPQALSVWTRHRESTHISPTLVQSSLQTALSSLTVFSKVAEECTNIFNYASKSVKENGTAYGYLKRSARDSFPANKKRKNDAVVKLRPDRQKIITREQLNQVVQLWTERNEHVALAYVEDTPLTFIKVHIKGLLRCHIFLDKENFNVDNVIVQGINEDISIWDQSSYNVFQCITLLACNLIDDDMWEGLVESKTLVEDMMDWIASYFNLLTKPCEGCGKKLRYESPKYGMLPPVQRRSHSTYSTELGLAHDLVTEYRARVVELEIQLRSNDREKESLVERLRELEDKLEKTQYELDELRYDPFTSLITYYGLESRAIGLMHALEREQDITAAIVEDLAEIKVNKELRKERDDALAQVAKLTMAVRKGDDALAQYAKLVRKLERRSSSSSDQIPNLPKKSTFDGSNGMNNETINEKRLCENEILSHQFNMERGNKIGNKSNEIMNEKRHRENGILSHQLKMEKDLHDMTRNKLGLLEAELDRRSLDEKANSKMIPQYMLRAQSLQNKLFDILYSLQQYHQDETSKTKKTIADLRHKLKVKEGIISEMAKKVDVCSVELTGASLRNEEIMKGNLLLQEKLHGTIEYFRNVIEMILTELQTIQDGPNCQNAENLRKYLVDIVQQLPSEETICNERLVISESIIQDLLISLVSETARRIDAERRALRLHQKSLKHGHQRPLSSTSPLVSPRHQRPLSPYPPQVSPRHCKSPIGRKAIDLYINVENPSLVR